MADNPRTDTPPRPTDADPATYRPVSAFAVAALMVAVLTALIGVGMIVASRVSHRPILNWWIVLAAIVGFCLAIVARRQIRRSEGTRVGLGLANAAWWISLLVGVGYGSYLTATDLAVRKQAEGVGDEFVRLLNDGQVEKAFRLTREPAQQRSIGPEDIDGIRRRFGANELPAFGRNELSRLVRFWGKQVKVEYLGSRENEQTPNGFKVPLAYLLRSPEGQVEFTVLTQAFDDTEAGSRGWMVVGNQTGAIIRAYQRTRLGRLIVELQNDAIRPMIEVWKKQIEAGPAAIEPLLRIDGDPPAAAKRQELAKELLDPTALTYVSRDPTKTVYPIAVVKDGALEIHYSVFVSTQSLGVGVHAQLIAKVKGEELTAEVRRLSGSNWEQEPLISPMDERQLLKDFRFQLVPVELNIYPNLPRDTGPREGPMRQ